MIKIGEKEPFGEFGFNMVKYFDSLLEAVEYILEDEILDRALDNSKEDLRGLIIGGARNES